MRKKLPCLLLQLCIWMLACLAIYFYYPSSLEPIYESVFINDNKNESTLEIQPGDQVSQEFLLTENELHDISLAFSYNTEIAEKATLLVEVYQEDDLIVEQPLPLIACPPEVFLAFATPLQDCEGETLRVCITNTSESPEAVFSVMGTTDYYRYQDYTAGYAFNTQMQEGSILCKFVYRTSYQYYRSISQCFWIFMVALILTILTGKGWSWLQQHKNHSPAPTGNRVS